MKNKMMISILLGVLLFLYMFYDTGSLLSTHQSIEKSIILEIRLPRILALVSAAIILSLSGLIFQVVLNNHLADSYALGIASGASLGSGIAVVTGLTLFVPVISVMMSLVALLIVLILSYYFRQHRYAVILFGMFMNFFFSSLLYMILLLNPKQNNQIMNYLFGSVTGVSMKDTPILIVTAALIILLVLVSYRSMSLLQLGELVASSLGLKVKVMEYIWLISSSTATAILISKTGIIGFIGLIIPAITLKMKGSMLNKIYLTILLSICLMVLGDLVGKQIFYPIEIPVSIMMSIICMPILLFIIIKEMK